jgi:hypothetical protein
MTTQVSQYDFRQSADVVTVEDMKATLRELASRWTFQREVSDGGYNHYQGRLSLKKKRRVAELKQLWRNQYDNGSLKAPLPNYIEPTSNPSKGEVFYATKLDTRVEGPWSDKDETKVLTRQLQNFMKFEYYPWQVKVMEIVKQYDERAIHIIYDQHGDLGKSVFCEYLEYTDHGFEIPPFRQMEDIMAFVMNFKPAKAYLVDMPRGMKKDKLGEFYSGLESLKNGFAYDKRYEGRKLRFDRPQIIVFTNHLPDFNLMSKDRWRVWETTPNKDIKDWAGGIINDPESCDES